MKDMTTNYPIALEYTVSRRCLNSKKNAVENECYDSDKFAAASDVSGVKYFLRVYPNGYNDEYRGQTCVFLHLKLRNERKVEAEYTLSVESANWDHQLCYTFQKSEGFGYPCCTVDELLYGDKDFIVDGKFTVKVEGILKIENVVPKLIRKILKPKRTTTKSFGDLWKTDFHDFTIVADGKEIKVHKVVLACQSPVFEAMFKSLLKEATENKLEIPDFSFDVVEKAVKLCYQEILVSDMSTDDAFWLLKFADKYDITVLKDNLEEHLGEKLTVSNACETAYCATYGNALKLQKKCRDFFVECLTMKYQIPNMDSLDKAFLISVFKKFSCHKSETP